eukprot:Gregarina_sp_Poly_1__3803@NODE_212_length_11327_cov_84_360924_g188_i0_p7_GENE_NODE_212_length_11327_cov_84_360924_g188_i0NODE_212_length_11327_cov_84_360924_g188_i0_p7_ORF_typecomplete_len218_score25_38BBE/PF08031_12/2_8e03BBE/PF08031_12/5_3e12Cytokinbind/PF09265_10/0_018ALO/PF04030_14/0_026_NODE_212_length_11327_cov_84_360924_g188_i063206973
MIGQQDISSWIRLRNRLPTPWLFEERDMDFMDAYVNVSDRLDEKPSREDLRTPVVPKRFAKKRSLILTAEELPVSRRLCRDLTAHALHSPEGSVIHVELMGGAIADLKREDTAFWHRDMILVISFTVVQGKELDAQTLEWVEAGYQLTLPFACARGCSYINYINLGMENETSSDLPHWGRRYHGGNVERLIQIRKKYDPHSVFSAPLSVARLPPHIS